jgi:polysaccharide chain length determinant protein (PEP-CTERM system associated)
MNVEQGFQLKDLSGIARRRLPIVALICGTVSAISLLVASWLPAWFEAYTTLLVEPQVISRRLVETGVEKSDLNQRLHLMTMQILSRSRLSKVLDDLKLYPDESERMTREEVIEMMRGYIRVEPVLPELEQQPQLRRQNVEVEINTFRLYFLHRDSATAAAVANRLANDFIEEHIKERVQVSGDTSEFIESELARLTSRIQEVEAKIAEVKSLNPGRLPDEFDANQRLLERAVDSLRAAQRELAEAQSDEAFYRQQALVSAAAPVANDDADPVRQLERLRLELTAYRSRGFTDKHPDVMAAQAQIAELESRIRSESADGGSGPTLSIAQQNAEAERRRASLRIASAQQEVERVNVQIEEITKKLSETPRVAEQLAALDREHQHLFASFQEFSNKRLEAGVAANMERRQKGEQFKVLEAAFAPPEAKSPNRPVIVIVGLMLGLALGAGIGILLESSDSSFHAVPDLQSTLRIPVLASIPAILLDSDRVLIRRRQLRTALATTAIGVFVLVGSASGYLYRNGLPRFIGGVPTAPATPGTPAPAAPAAPASPGAADPGQG